MLTSSTSSSSSFNYEIRNKKYPKKLKSLTDDNLRKFVQKQEKKLNKTNRRKAKKICLY